MQKSLVAVATAYLLTGQVSALEVLRDDTKSMAISGRVGLQTETKNSETVVDNDAARIKFSLEHDLVDDIKGFAAFEWGYNIHNDYQHKDVTFVKIETEGQHLTNRLGYLGVQHDMWGTVTLGKQASVYSDIADWTSEYAIGGGKALGQTGFTKDGAFSGTDRAEDAITYRIDLLEGLSLGLQYQLGSNKIAIAPNNLEGVLLRANRVERDEDEDDEGDDQEPSYSTMSSRPVELAREGHLLTLERDYGYQVALSYYFDEYGVSIGSTYAETSFKQGFAQGESENLKSTLMAFAVKYDVDDIYLAAGYGKFKNHTTASSGLAVAVVKKDSVQHNMLLDKESEGIELYGRYNLSQLWDGGLYLQAGWNNLKVNENPDGDKTDSKLDQIMVGAIYKIGSMQFAAEYTWDQSKSELADVMGHNNKFSNSLNLQARYTF